MNALPRREFLKRAGGLVALAAAGPEIFGEGITPQHDIKKAIMYATVSLKGSVMEKLKAIKEAGFKGVEMMSHMSHEEVLQARDETGLNIPSVCCATNWRETMASPNPNARARALEGLKQALQDAKAYGASSVLFVPASVNQEIAYDDAYTRSQAEIRKAIPLAEELGVKIAIENVWNNFLLSPLEAARYVDEFNSPFVGWHFDVGNCLRNGWPEQWIRILGKRIQKLHIKEFSRKKMQEEGLWKGFNVKFLEGDNNWPAVMRALDDIGYKGWGMAEQAGGDTLEGLKDLSQRMDKIFAS